MMKNIIISIVFGLVTINTYAQNNFDIRTGLGVSYNGRGDVTLINSENELNYKINNLLSSSISLNLGRSDLGVYLSSSFTQINSNLFISPFQTNQKYDIRFGLGASYLSGSETYVISEEYNGGELVKQDLEYNKVETFGYNFIAEYTHHLNNRYFVGLKGSLQSYKNNHHITGLMIKFGVKL